MEFKNLYDFNTCTNSIIHNPMTLNGTHLWDFVVCLFSLFQHVLCLENVLFHFITTIHYWLKLHRIIATMFSYLTFLLYYFNANLMHNKTW
uniref:Uncharacterized protein n=1 Tax=Cajanus cajan TaxID=3821 RepID=A0A151TGM4_CAJCA|nr:hypothetical protein KK1_012491 [Cajanus cajan]